MNTYNVFMCVCECARAFVDNSSDEHSQKGEWKWQPTVNKSTKTNRRPANFQLAQLEFDGGSHCSLASAD